MSKYYYKGIPINYLTYNGRTEANDVSGATVYFNQFPGKDTTTIDTIRLVRPVDLKYSMLNNIGLYTKRTAPYVDISGAISNDVSLNSYINTTNLGFTPNHISAILIGGGGGGGGSGGGKNPNSGGDTWGGLGAGGAGGGQAFLYKYIYNQSNLSVRCGTGGAGGAGGASNRGGSDGGVGTIGSNGNASYIKDSGVIIVSANGGSGGGGGNGGTSNTNGTCNGTIAGGNATGTFSYTNVENTVFYTGNTATSTTGTSQLTTGVNLSFNTFPNTGTVSYRGFDISGYTNIPLNYDNTNIYMPAYYGRGGIGGSANAGSGGGDPNIAVKITSNTGNTDVNRKGASGYQGFIRVYLLYE
jgi:hypothetical protein